MFQTDVTQGLSHGQAGIRLQKNGFNELKDDDKKSVFGMFFEQLCDPLIYVLLIAAAASVFLKEISDALIILVVVGINAVVGVIQEGKAQKALESLKRLSSPHTLVLRQGETEKIEARMLVPGDIVRLEAGDQVPADLRLIFSCNLQVDESALTG